MRLLTGMVPCPLAMFANGYPTMELIILFASVPTAVASLPGGLGNTNIGRCFSVDV